MNETTKSNNPFATMQQAGGGAMAAIEQGLKVFTSIYKRTHRSLKKEFRKLYELNARYLDDEKIFSVLDADRDITEDETKVSRKDYESGDNDIIPYADPNVSSEQQRLAKIEALQAPLQMGLINPQEWAKRYLEATEQPDIATLMKVDPPQPDPNIVLAEIELKHKIAIEWFDRRLAALKEDREALKTRADVLLSIAKAEGEEEGRQLEQYKTVADSLDKVDKQIQDLMLQEVQQRIEAQKQNEQQQGQQPQQG